MNNPLDYAAMVKQLAEETDRTAVPAARPRQASDDTFARLKMLCELTRSGVISEEQFKEGKQKILAS